MLDTKNWREEKKTHSPLMGAFPNTHPSSLSRLNNIERRRKRKGKKGQIIDLISRSIRVFAWHLWNLCSNTLADSIQTIKLNWKEMFTTRFRISARNTFFQHFSPLFLIDENMERVAVAVCYSIRDDIRWKWETTRHFLHDNRLRERYTQHASTSFKRFSK